MIALPPNNAEPNEPCPFAKFPTRKRRYLKALAQNGSVVLAAKAAKIGRVTVWTWRQPGAKDRDLFVRAEEIAKALGLESLESEAIRRALAGSDRLIEFILERAWRTKYGRVETVEHSGPGGGPIRITELVVSTREHVDRLSDLRSPSELS